MKLNRPLQVQTHNQLQRAGETPALQIQRRRHNQKLRQRRPPEGGRYNGQTKINGAQLKLAATNSRTTATAGGLKTAATTATATSYSTVNSGRV
jgi:hypothetical protein